MLSCFVLASFHPRHQCTPQPTSLRNLRVRSLPRPGRGVGACPESLGALDSSLSLVFSDFQLSTFDLSFPLSPLLATDPRKRLLSLIIATLPKTPSRKSFVCHTSKTPRGPFLLSARPRCFSPRRSFTRATRSRFPSPVQLCPGILLGYNRGFADPLALWAQRTIRRSEVSA
jgi:hypothetical protein